MKRKKQLLSWVLSFLMVFSIMPIMSISALGMTYDNNHILVNDTLNPGDIIENSNSSNTITIYYEGLDPIGVLAGEQYTVCDFPSSDEYMLFNWKVNEISTSGGEVTQIELTQNWEKVHKITYDMTNITVSKIDVDGDKFDIGGQTSVTTGSAVAVTLAADTGYTLPNTVAVEMGGIVLDNPDYEYDQATGKVRVFNVTGEVKITAVGVEEEKPPVDPPTPPNEDPNNTTTGPAISIGQVTSVGKTSATLKSSITLGAETIIDQGFEWKETNGGNYAQKPGTLKNGILTAILTGLTKNTRYTVRPFVVIGANTYYGAENTFKTKKSTSSGSSSSSSSSKSKSDILIVESTEEAIIKALKTSEYKKIQVNIDSNPNLLLSKAIIDALAENKDKTLILVSNNVSTNISINENNEMKFTRNEGIITGFVSVCNAEYYTNSDGIVKKEWVEYPKDAWYYFDKETGIKRKGWVEDKESWYYLNQSGLMQTGWINDNGVWYYLDKSGEMLSNTTIDGFVLGSTGAWIA